MGPGTRNRSGVLTAYRRNSKACANGDVAERLKAAVC